MDPFTRLLILMARWWRNPPGRRTATVMLVAIVLAFLIAGFEHLFGWPDWLTTERVSFRRLPS